MTARSLFLGLLDQPEIDLDELHARMDAESPVDLGSLITLSRKLPSGFVHADALCLVSEAPPDLEPLAPGSAWYAAGRELIVVVRFGDRFSAAAILELVYRYYCAARQVFEKIGDQTAILNALLSGEDIDADKRAQWALRLDAPVDFFHRIQSLYAELRFDLGWMGRRRFCPLVHVHASLRPGLGRDRGREGALKLLEQLPEGPIRLLVSDHHGAIDPVSPYLRDLTAPICQWGRENESRLSVEGLFHELDQAAHRNSLEMATLVLPDLLDFDEELLIEKRKGESQAGLHFVCDDALKIGWASPDKLEGGDDFVFPNSASAEAKSLLLIISASSIESLCAASRAVLDSGRVQAVSAVFALEGAHLPALTSSSCLFGLDTAVRLEHQDKLLAKAKELGIEIEVQSGLDLTTGPRFNPCALQLAQLIYRQKQRQRIGDRPGKITEHFLFYRQNTDSEKCALNFGLGRLHAHRLALATLLAKDDATVKPGQTEAKYKKLKHYRV